MKRHSQDSDIPIRSAVIAWQPTSFRRTDSDAAAGSVVVLRLLDPMVLSYAMTHGACWCDWAEQSIPKLIDTLEWLKSVLVDDYRIAPRNIEAAFAIISEYRRRRTERDDQCNRNEPR